MSTAPSKITHTATASMINNHNNDNRDEQHTLNSNERTTMKTTNVDDGRQNQRDRKKGERERRENNVERTLSMREQESESIQQTNTNTDSVMSFTTEQYNCSNVNESMATHTTSSLNSNIDYQNMSPSNNHSTYTTNSSNSPSWNHHSYESSSPYLSRYRTLPSRRTDCFDQLYEEIISDEILEIIELDHYPTLNECWGDDAKTIVRQQGEFQIEDYVEFQEIEPTIIEEITYEITYLGDQIQLTKEIYHSHSESRNFRRIQKRRTKCKRTQQLPNETDHLPITSDSISNQTTPTTTTSENIIPKEFKQPPAVRFLTSNGDQSSLQSLHSNEQKVDFSSNQTSLILFPTLPGHKLIDQEYIKFIESQSSTTTTPTSIDEKNIFPNEIDCHSSTTIEHPPEPKNKRMTIDAKQDSQSIIKSDELPTSNIFPETDEKTTTENEVDHLSSVSTHLPSINIQTETTKSIKKPSINSFIDILETLETTISSPSPATLVPIPSKTIETDEKSITDLTNEINKPSEMIPIQPTTISDENLIQKTDANENKLITTKSVNQTTETIISDEKQPSDSSLSTLDQTLPTVDQSIIEINDQHNITSMINSEENELLESSKTFSTSNSPETTLLIPTNSNICINVSFSTTPITSESTKPSSEELTNTSHQSETTLPEFDRHPSITIEPTSSSYFPSIEDDEQSDNSDLIRTYYELQEQRQNQETSNYLDLKPFPLLSNLPSTQYHQVFGVLNDVVNTIEEQTLQPIISNEVKLSTINSNENSPILQTIDDHPSIISADEKELPTESTSSITSNVELDSRYSLLLSRMNTLLKPLLDSSSSLFPTKNESDTNSHVTTQIEIPTLPNINSNEQEETLFPLIVPTKEITNTSVDEQPIEENISSDVVDSTTSVTPDINKNSLITTTNEVTTIPMAVDQITSTAELIKPNNEVLPPVVSDSELVNSRSSEEIVTPAEVSQQPSSTGSLEVSSLLSPETSTEAHSQCTHHSEDVATKLNEENDLPSVITKLTSVLNNALSTVQNLLPTSSNDTDQKQEHHTIQASEISLQVAKTNEEEHHDEFDISNLDSSDELTTVVESPLNLSGKSLDDTQPSEDLSNDKKQQMSTETVKEVDDSILPTEEQVTQIPKQHTQYEVATTEFNLVSFTHPPPYQQLQVINDDYPLYSNHYNIVDAEEKLAQLHTQYKAAATEFDRVSSTHSSSYQQLQVINDDYPWYSNYYNIVDAEAKLAQLHIQSNLADEPSLSPVTLEVQSSVSSVDTDRAPTILQEHPDTLSTVSPNINSSNKKKHKKKKKDTKEVISSNASEPISPDANNRKIETLTEITDSSQIDQTLSKTIQESEQLNPISAIISNTQELKQADDQTNKSISSNATQLLSTPVLKPPEDVNLNIQVIQKQPILQTSTKNIPIPKEEDEEEDDEGFQLVHYRKGILSPIKSKTAPPSPTIPSKHPLSSNTDPKTSEIHEQQTSPPVTQSTASKTKKKKKNKSKKQTVSSSPSNTDSTVEVKPQAINQETILQSPLPSSSITEYSNVQSQPTLPPTIRIKQSVSLDEEDNEGFQVVTYRKRITSAPTSSSSPTKAAYKHNVNLNTKLPSRSIPRTTTNNEISSNKNKPKQKSLFNIPSRFTSTNTTNNFDVLKDIKQETEQSDEYLQSIKQIAKEHQPSTSSEEQQSTEITSKLTNNDSESEHKPSPTTTLQNSQSKKTNEHTLSSPTIDTDSIPLSVEETTDQPISNSTPVNNDISNSDEATQNIEPDASQNRPQSITYEEVSTTSTELPDVLPTPSLAESIKSTDLPLPTDQIEEETPPSPTINTESNSTKSTSTKKPAKRRKKKAHTEEKPIDTAPNSSTIIQSNLQISADKSHHQTPPLTDETKTKLDLFLPEYMRQQITDSNSTSSNSIRKKKSRPKMLSKDSEAKSLLTNEFDNNKQLNEDDIHDDDEFIIHTDTSNNSSLDNILSRGFYLWLKESQALSQQQNQLQSISTNLPEKRIHIANAYAINHPGSISAPSWLNSQSNDRTFQKDSRKLHSDDEDSPKKENSSDNDNQQSNGNRPQTNFSTDNVQQFNTNSNPSMNFDDWAYFYEHKNSYQIENDLECFYTRPFDDDTLLSDTKPIHHRRERYGDFLSSDIPKSTIQFPLQKSKPSEYFQNRRKQYTNDDEVFLSHSSNGLSSRSVKP